MTQARPRDAGSIRVEIDQVGVVVPARNEERELPGCLRGLAEAVKEAGVPVFVVVVLDTCTDNSADIAADMIADLSLPAVCIASNAAAVGAARREGVEFLLAGTSWLDDLARLWITTTDADSVVPTDWLHAHVRHARTGAEIVAGTVDVEDWTSWPAGVEARYRTQYAKRMVSDGHGHVHGANLGIRADTYLAIDGFSTLAGDEDVDLIRRAQTRGVAVTWAMDVAVRTSARRRGRASAGFADHLRGIAAQLATELTNHTRSANA